MKGKRFKRCIEISPSALKTIKNLRISTSTAATTSTKRGLSFSVINSLQNVVSISLNFYTSKLLVKVKYLQILFSIT